MIRFLLLVAALLATDASAQVSDLDRRTSEVASQLRCVVCQGISIEDSPSELAQEMRATVREQLAAGRTPDEVKAYFIARYGEWVLLEPEPAGFNLLIYIMPVLVLLSGAAFVLFTARRLTRERNVTAEHAETAEH